MVHRKNQTNVSVRKQIWIRDVFSNDNNHPFFGYVRTVAALAN